MRFFSLIILLILSVNIYGQKPEMKLEKRAITYYTKGEFDKYLNTVIRLIKRYPYSKTSEFYLLTMEADRALFKQYDKFSKLILNKFTEYKNKPFLYHILLNKVINYYITEGNFQKAGELSSAEYTGVIEKWRYTKPYIDTFYNDINKNFNNIEPLPDIKKWSTFTNISDMGWIPLQDIIYPEYGTVYASCNIKVKKDTQVIIWLITTADVKLFINSKKIFNNIYEKKLNNIWKVKLNKGWNNILLKLFNNKNVSWNFKFKILNTNGTPFTDYTLSLENKKIAKKRAEAEIFYPDVYNYFQNRAKGSSHSLDYYHYGLLEFIFFNNKKAINSLIQAKEISDRYKFMIHFLLGRIYIYLSGNRRNTFLERSFIEFNSLLKCNPDFIRGREYIAKYFLIKNRFTKAFETLNSIKPKYHTILKLYASYFKKIDWEFMENEYNNYSFKLNKNYYSVVKDIAEFYKVYNPDKSNYVLTNTMKNNFSTDFIRMYINNLFNSMNTNFLRYTDIFYRINPYDRFYYKKRADYYVQLKEYNKAIRILKSEKYLLRFPDILIKIGDIYYINNIKDKAVYYYKRALKKLPSDYKLREKINFIKEKKFSLNPERIYLKEINAEKIIQKAFQDKKSYDAPIKYYLDEMIIKINKDGTYRYFIHQIYKILNLDGKNNYGEVQIDGADYIIRLQVINHTSLDESYEAYEKREYNNTYYVSVPSLSIGSVIEVLYEYSGNYSMLDNTHYFYYYPFTFQSMEAPVENAVFCAVVPKDIHLKYEVRNNNDIDSDIYTAGGYNVYVWNKKYSERIKSEEDAVSTYDILPNIYISIIPGWNKIFEWYKGKFINFTDIGWELQKKVYNIYQSATYNGVLNVYEFIKSLYYYIQNNFIMENNYLFYPEDINDTFFKQKANSEKKSLLLKSILNRFNIKSDLILVRNKNYSRFNLKVPVPFYFSDILLYIPPQFNIKKSLYIDFNNKFIPFGYIDNYLNNINGFNISTGKTEYINNSKKGFIAEKYEVFVTNNNMLINGHITFTGTENKAKEYFINSFNRKSRIFSMLNNMIPNINILNYSIDNYDNLEKDLSIFINGAKKVETERDILFDKFDLSRNYISMKKRKFPLRISFQMHKKIITEVRNKRLEKKEVIINSEFGRYKYRVNNNIIEREIYIPIQIISTDKYEKFIEFCRKVDRYEKIQ